MSMVTLQTAAEMEAAQKAAVSGKAKDPLAGMTVLSADGAESTSKGIQITEKALKRGSHTSLPQLRDAILAYVDAHNENRKPFRWTKTADEILDNMRRFGMRTQQVHGA